MNVVEHGHIIENSTEIEYSVMENLPHRES